MHTPYTREIPNARAAILCLHGILGSPAHFKPFLPFFPKTHSVYTLLLKGHGGTTRDFSRASMAQWKQQVEENVRFLSEKYEEIYIVAHSMGTFFAMEASLAFPKVKGIFLLAVPFKIRVCPTAVLNSVKAFFGLHSKEDAVGQAYIGAHSVTLSKKPWEYIGWLPRYRELFRESRVSRKTICRIAVPCCIVQSEKDELVSPASLSHIPQRENITVATLPASRHFIYDRNDMPTLSGAFQNFFKGEKQ